MSRWMAAVVAGLLLVGMTLVGYAVLYSTWFYTDDVLGQRIDLDFRDVAEVRGGGRFWVDLVMLIVGVGLWELRVGALAVSLATGKPMPLQWTSLQGSFGHTAVLASIGMVEALSIPRVITLFGDEIHFEFGLGIVWLGVGLAVVQGLVTWVHARAREMKAVLPAEGESESAAPAAPLPVERPMIKAPLGGPPVAVDGDPFRGGARPVIAVQQVVAPKASPRAETADPNVEQPKLLR